MDFCFFIHTECIGHTFLSHLSHIRLVRQILKPCYFQKELHFFRNISKTVNQLLYHIVHLFLRLDGSNSLINIQLMIFIWYIRIRNIRIDIDIQCCRKCILF